MGVSEGYPDVHIAFGILGSNYLVDLELSAAQTENLATVISSPRVITANQQEASIKQGIEIPYQQSASSGATTIAFKDAVLLLKVKPLITPDNRIILDLNVINNSRSSDVVIGAPRYNKPGNVYPPEGAAFVFRGSPSGVQGSTPASAQTA